LFALSALAMSALSQDIQVETNTEVEIGPDDMTKTLKEIIYENGFHMETYTVETEDGYLLDLFRIPGKTGSPAVFLQHGILDSADCWAMNYGNDTIAFTMAREGYDVYLGNSRGNKYSRHHTSLNPDKDNAFWDFSFAELGKYDLPAQVDKALELSGQESLTYFGHSQGTTQMYYAAVHEPEYIKEKINLFVALAPVVKLTHGKSNIIDLAADHYTLLKDTFKLIGLNELLPANWLQQTSTDIICGAIPSFCLWAESFVATTDPSLDDTERFQVYMGHFPSGTSLNCILHYGQIKNADRFQEFDYDSKDENQKHYGQDTPPEINIASITDFPIHMVVGNEDALGDTQDNQWVKSVIGSTLVEYDAIEAGHLTFMDGKDMSFMDQVVKNVKKYNPVSASDELFLF
jgi:pimeloyl-ACP methyl ester carboxylesterase